MSGGITNITRAEVTAVAQEPAGSGTITDPAHAKLPIGGAIDSRPCAVQDDRQEQQAESSSRRLSEPLRPPLQLDN
jgi:hypothetical protein